MKLYAQHGYGEGDKIKNGIEQNLISGVIYGARDISPERLDTRLEQIARNSKKFNTLFDPQYYVTLIAANPNIRLGKLEEYPYFKTRRRSQLESSDLLFAEIDKILDFQVKLPLTDIISPNILISQSFDSVEAVISKNFIREARKAYKKFHDKRPIYATLAISREALLEKNELESFLNDITLIDSPPDGFYLLIEARSIEARSDIFNMDVIAGWMLLNYSLKINGYNVINGYSDLLSPFLGAVGGDIGCTGWWSNLRTFSLDRFIPESGGGRLPIQRYFSFNLLNRITYYELDALKNMFPDVLNGLSFDSEYLKGTEPDRVLELFQSWEALKPILRNLTENDIEENLNRCTVALDQATELYARIKSRYRLDTKSDDSHLEPIKMGIDLFKKLAQI